MRAPRECSPLCALALLILLAITCGGVERSAAQSGAFTCRPANVTLMPFCGGEISYLVSSLSDEADLDASAASWSEQYGASTEYGTLCPFWASRVYQCRKYFTECVEGQDSQGNTTSRLNRICRDTCMRAETADDGACSKAFVPGKFVTECNDPPYYTAFAPCADFSVNAEGISVESGLWWRILLGAGIGIIAVVCLCMLYWRHKRDNWSAEQMAKHDEEKAAKLRRKKAKKEEAEARRAEKAARKRGGAKGEADKYAAGGPAALSSSGAVAAAVSPSPSPPPDNLRPAHIELTIVEPGMEGAEGVASPVAAAAAAAAGAGEVDVASPVSSGGEGKLSPHSGREGHKDRKHRKGGLKAKSPAPLDTSSADSPRQTGADGSAQPRSARSARNHHEKKSATPHLGSRTLTPAERAVAAQQLKDGGKEEKQQHQRRRAGSVSEKRSAHAAAAGAGGEGSHPGSARSGGVPDELNPKRTHRSGKNAPHPDAVPNGGASPTPAMVRLHLASDPSQSFKRQRENRMEGAEPEQNGEEGQ